MDDTIPLAAKTLLDADKPLSDSAPEPEDEISIYNAFIIMLICGLSIYWII